MVSDTEIMIKKKTQKAFYLLVIYRCLDETGVGSPVRKKLISKWPGVELSHIMFSFVLILLGADGFWLGRAIVKRDSSKLGSFRS